MHYSIRCISLHTHTLLFSIRYSPRDVFLEAFNQSESIHLVAPLLVVAVVDDRCCSQRGQSGVVVVFVWKMRQG